METAKIFVVDDEESVRFFIGEVLSSRGYSVKGASCGEHALMMMRSEKPDLVVLDYRMTDMTGLEVLEQMRQEKIDASVILLTAYGTLDIAIDLMRSGGVDFLKKPCSNEELLSSVERVLQKRRAETKRTRVIELMEETLRQAEALELLTPVPAVEEKNQLTEVHGLLLDRRQEIVRRGSEVLPLTRTEFRLLCCLVEQPDIPVSYTRLYEAVYGLPAPDDDALEARQALSTHLWRLRQKLGNDDHGRPYIINVHGGRYRFVSK